MQARIPCICLIVLIGNLVLQSHLLAEPPVPTPPGIPELGIAVLIDRHTLEIHRFVQRELTRTTIPRLPPGIKIEIKSGSIEAAPVTERVPIIETHITRMNADKVVVRRVDGRLVSHKELINEYSKPAAILLSKPGPQADLLLWKLFKPESPVLILPLPSPSVPDTVAPPTVTPVKPDK